MTIYGGDITVNAGEGGADLGGDWNWSTGGIGEGLSDR